MLRSVIGSTLVTAMIAAAVAVGSAPAAADDLDDDMVVFDAETGELIDSPYKGAILPQGYALMQDTVVNAYSYTVKLVASPRVEQYRSTVQSVANELRAAGFAQLTVAAGTFTPEANQGPADHEIWVWATSTSSCASNGGGVLGCGGPGTVKRAGGTDSIALSGKVWLLPSLDVQNAAYKYNVVAHELGHALGLDHYDAAFQNLLQMMHSSVQGITAYRAGDKAGLTSLNRDIKPDGTIDSVTVPSAGKLRVTGWAYDPDQRWTPTVRITVDGVTAAQQQTTVARPDVNTAYKLTATANRGYDITVNAAAGVHEVCLAVLDFPRSSFDRVRTCKQVTAGGGVTTSRIQGSDRYESAVAVSKTAYPGTAPVVVVASGEDFPDALAAGPVAAMRGGPLLLTQAAALTAATRTEITRLKPSTIVIAGGTASVSDAVVTALKPLAAAVVRIGGGDRYETSRKLATYAFASATTAFVSSGDAFPDALSASAAAASLKAPLLLVGGGSTAVDSATAAQIKTLKATSARVVGGTAVVADTTVNTIKASIPSTTRVSGADRFLSSVAVSKNAFTGTTSQVFVVNGMNFPDGLVTAPLAARTGSPVFLSPGYCVNREIIAEMSRLGTSKLTLVGGTTSLTADVAGLQFCA